MITNPIKPVGIIATPKSLKSFEAYLANFTGSESTVAQVCAWQAWNLASKYADRAITAANERIAALEGVIENHNKKDS